VKNINSVCAMAVYFLTDGESTEHHEHRCLFCGSVFEQKKALSVHYLGSHSSAFSAEEIFTAMAAHEMTGRKLTPY
jgi:hypothetical protein